MTTVEFDAYDGQRSTEDPSPLTLNDYPTEEVPMELARIHTEGSGLSERDQRILEFERQWWKYAGAKEQAIRDLFDMSSTRYYQIINTLIDTPEAMAFDPMLVKRLRRMRSARQRARSSARTHTGN
ncbi:MAG: hypothetical protein RJB01_791 [Actinomycetota bacterium]|jgi:hypothetical protein